MAAQAASGQADAEPTDARPGQHLPAPGHRASFDLFEAARRLPYLHDLGVDWVYLSPLLAAEPGSDHGYDVVAHDRVDASRGGAEGLAALSAEARRLGMGVLVDIVPNHVGVATPPENAWWWDLLRARPGLARTRRRSTSTGTPAAAGCGSRWSATTTCRRRRPRSRTCRSAGGELRYHDHRFPLAPGTADDRRRRRRRPRPPARRAGRLAARRRRT